MTLLNQGAPRVHYEGIRDLSGRVIVSERDKEPTHIPLVFTLCQKQIEEPTLVYPSQIDRILGELTFARGSKFFSHVSEGIGILSLVDNPFLVYPVRVEGAKKSFLRLSLLVTDLVPEDGENISSSENNPVTRYKLAWTNDVELYGLDDKEFGKARKTKLNDTTTLYPILEAEIEFAGEYGNNYGIQFNQVPSNRIRNINNTLLMNMTLVKRKDYSHYDYIKSINGEEKVTFSFDRDAVDNLGKPLQIDRIFEDHYTVVKGNNVMNFGEFGKFKVYYDYFEEVQMLVYEEEKFFDNNIPEYYRNKWSLKNNPTNSRCINILTGRLPDEKTSYKTFIVDKGMLIGNGNAILATGGDDGFTEEKTLAKKFAKANSLVDTFLYELRDDVISPSSKLLNRNRWDYSVVYDTGFARLAKETLILLNIMRTDITIFYTPKTFGEIEVIPDVVVLQHHGYMRSVNNFQPIPYTRDREVEVKGLITNLAADREIREFKLYVDGKEVAHKDFLIDSKGYWSADVNTSGFGLRAYKGKVHFVAKIGVKNHDEIPLQEVISTEAEYTILPAALPKASITNVWDNLGITYTASTPPFVVSKEKPGSLVANIISSDGPLEELFEISNAKFVFNSGLEVDVSKDFIVWDKPFANPSHKTFLNGMEKENGVKLVFDATDRISKITTSISSPVFDYPILFPDLVPVSVIKTINSGLPIMPNYDGLENTDLVRVTGEVTGIGIDNLLDLSKVRLKVNGITVQNITPVIERLYPSLTNPENKFAWYADIPRAYFPVTALDVNRFNVGEATEELPDEIYHAKAPIEATVEIISKHENGSIKMLKSTEEVNVSDIVSTSINPVAPVNYEISTIPSENVNDGFLLKDNLEDIDGYIKVPVELNNSFFNYRELVSAYANLGNKQYDIKIKKNFTEAAVYVPKVDLFESLPTSKNLTTHLTVKHDTNKQVTFNSEVTLNITYPEAPVYKGEITTINNDVDFWFDEDVGNPNKEIAITGKLPDNLSPLYPIFSTSIIINNVETLVNISGEEWSTTLPLTKFDLANKGEVKLKFKYRSLINNNEFTFTSEPKEYRIRNIDIPVIEFLSFNPEESAITVSRPVMWRSDIADRTVDVYITIKDSAKDKWIIDDDVYTEPLFTMKKDGTIIRGIIWSKSNYDGKEVYLAKVPYGDLLDSTNHFDEQSTLTIEAGFKTKHNNRNYNIGPDELEYTITPRTGEVMVEINRVEYDPVEAYEEPDNLFEISGIISGLVPNQEVLQLVVTVGDDEVEVIPVETQYSPKTLVDGFYTIPFLTKIKNSDLLKGKILPASQNEDSIPDSETTSEDIDGFYTNDDRVERPIDDDTLDWDITNDVEQVENLINTIGVTVTTNF